MYGHSTNLLFGNNKTTEKEKIEMLLNSVLHFENDYKKKDKSIKLHVLIILEADKTVFALDPFYMAKALMEKNYLKEEFEEGKKYILFPLSSTPSHKQKESREENLRNILEFEDSSDDLDQIMQFISSENSLVLPNIFLSTSTNIISLFNLYLSHIGDKNEISFKDFSQSESFENNFSVIFDEEKVFFEELDNVNPFHVSFNFVNGSISNNVRNSKSSIYYWIERGNVLVSQIFNIVGGWNRVKNDHFPFDFQYLLPDTPPLHIFDPHSSKNETFSSSFVQHILENKKGERRYPSIFFSLQFLKEEKIIDQFIRGISNIDYDFNRVYFYLQINKDLSSSYLSKIEKMEEFFEGKGSAIEKIFYNTSFFEISPVQTKINSIKKCIEIGASFYFATHSILHSQKVLIDLVNKNTHLSSPALYFKSQYEILVANHWTNYTLTKKNTFIQASSPSGKKLEETFFYFKPTK